MREKVGRSGKKQKKHHIKSIHGTNIPRITSSSMGDVFGSIEDCWSPTMIFEGSGCIESRNSFDVAMTGVGAIGVR